MMDEPTDLGKRVAATMLEHPNVAGVAALIGEKSLAGLIDREIGLGGLELDMAWLASRPPWWQFWRWPEWIRGVRRIGWSWLCRLYNKKWVAIANGE